MIYVLAVLAVLAGGSLGGGLLSYISGRIILPEMGLQAPHYMPWVWVWFFGLIASGIVYFIKGAVD